MEIILPVLDTCWCEVMTTLMFIAHGSSKWARYRIDCITDLLIFCRGTVYVCALCAKSPSSKGQVLSETIRRRAQKAWDHPISF